ncbi:putative protein kinase RLK-Pelle-URK-2 family [Rosa chinensis]|uniref:Protein kinase domain-containing protein n=1 Tax=Rosa chinensis TaxID=74649 RepID=A0A2P6SCB9_ROSCH|nr:putative protein kinase RLK-Pelle-URK-2 family [Rosa chinensis]
MSCFNWLLYLAAALAVIRNELLVDSASDKKHHSGPVVNVTKHLMFPDFNLSYNPRILNDVKLLGSAKLASKTSAIQIPDESHVTDLRHQAGRAIYSSSIRLLDPHTETPASFETTFSFQFHNASSSSPERIQTTQSGGYGNGGSGLAFVIVPDEFTVGRPGAWLAMLNDACEDDYKVITIEFDTRLNPEFGDPNDNHVGINLGTIISTETINASDVGVFLNDGSIHRAWISYNGSRRWMEIRLGSDDGSYPAKPVFSGSLDLSPFLNEYMFVGFSASTGNHTQIHSVLSWNFTSVSQAFLRVPSIETCESKIVVTENSRAEPPGTFLIFIAVLALAIAVMLSLYYNSKRRSANSDSASIVLPEKKQRPRPPNKPRSFTISEISLATRSFGALEILGGGSKGVCYRGKLPNGCQVAVKRRLMKEIKGISRVRHPNLVSIRGWCQDKKEIMVVYEFFSNGSLDKWLFGVGVLPWTRRLMQNRWQSNLKNNWIVPKVENEK